MKIFPAFCLSTLLATPLLVSAQASNQLIDRYVVVDGHKMHYQIRGAGNTTIVFENGHGDELSTWDDIFTDVSKFSKVVRYDRMGYGLSEATTQPRSLKQIATELHSMLQRAHIHPPYILVGHSMGGALIRAFAYLYKDETAGLVFIDPFNEYEVNGITKDQIIDEMKMEDSIMKQAPPLLLAEYTTLRNEITTGFPELYSFGDLPDVPMAMLVAGKDRPGKWEINLVELFEAKMSKLSESRLVVLPQSPHYIHHFDPATVIESIRRIVFPDAENRLRKTLRDKGIDACIDQYKKMKTAYPKEYLRERILNTLGYEALQSKNIKDAIALFSLNVAMYPNSYNTYDSLGEAYMDAGNKKEAIKNYETSVALNPANANALRMLNKLK